MVNDPIRIKFVSKTDARDIERLWSPLIPTGGFQGVEFTFNPDDENYDFLAVYEGLPKWSDRKTSDRYESLSCARSNTLLITTEPSSIRLDGPHFMRQFGYVLTNKAPELIKHPDQIRETPPLRWFYGRPMDGTGGWLTIDQIAETTPIKTANLSTVCSTKKMAHTVHAARLNFVTALRDRLPDLDVYGRGIRPISDKAEAMAAYKYHIAIENHIEVGHWTEKLSDCFLAGCLPFYFGDPEYAKVFPEKSVIPIDIFDLDGAESIIRKAIERDEYSARQNALLDAKNRVLSQHNTLGWVANFVRNSDLEQSRKKSDENRIFNRHAFRRRYPIKAVYDFIFVKFHRGRPTAQPIQSSHPRNG